MFDEIIQLRSEWSLLHFEKEYADYIKRFDKIILDIDLDFRDPQMGFENIEKTYKQVRKIIALSQVDVITIATSPYFMDQQTALHIAKEIC
jgi:predicted amino acid racemase